MSTTIETTQMAEAPARPKYLVGVVADVRITDKEASADEIANACADG